MFERFTEGARTAVVSAQSAAHELGDGRIGTEHVLLGLVGGASGSAARALAEHGAGPEEVRGAVRALERGHPAPRRGLFGRRHLPFTRTAKKALELALREAIRLNGRGAPIRTGHVLLGLLRAEGRGAEALARLGADRAALRGTAERLLREA
ncbi:Clp protease N-terminal domain-containing protein [Nocardiopsis composta]|uniref:ATP-dependent Clp protease ATP-binding subunit ClpC n=1 Tax=Nocardiopsis composta TaxID=157465 RepID=A0A7W8QN82_9ACTN|nr:Clp protease N-terminal domain-containing protein [Nocardiopsis composta]MBB5433381.1 ATP-dependent Clp protease ATP-binding subunit ClpC [Nocardiopsis composta]